MLPSGPVANVPLVATVPDQPPEAVHDVASVELHVRVELSPLFTVLGYALRSTVGAGATMTVVAAEVEPLAPVQLNVNVEVVVKGPVD